MTIDAAEYLQLRQRVMIAAEAAHKIASSPQQLCFFDHETYALVMEAMLSLKTDIRKLVAECQILRGENSERLVPVMGSLPAPADQPSSEGERLHDTGPTVGVPASGSNRKARSRSLPGGNKSRSRKVPKKLDATGGGVAVDRAQ
jgi:hypothetical protein